MRAGDEDDDIDDIDDIDDDLDDPGRDDRPGHAAAYASNWKTVLAVDAAMGVAVLMVGLVLAVVWNLVLGALGASLGLAYVMVVGRRARAWRALRDDAGLP